MPKLESRALVNMHTREISRANIYRTFSACKFSLSDRYGERREIEFSYFQRLEAVME